MEHHLMKKCLTDLLTNFSVLSGETIGPSGSDWHAETIAAVTNLRVLADCLDRSRHSMIPVFPSPVECADAAGIND